MRIDDSASTRISGRHCTKRQKTDRTPKPVALSIVLNGAAASWSAVSPLPLLVAVSEYALLLSNYLSRIRHLT